MYFEQATSSSRTSENVFSALLEPLTQESYSQAIAASQSKDKNAQSLQRLQELHTNDFPRFVFELSQGFNLLFYGYGSKRDVLNEFGMFCSSYGNVAVCNAFLPNFSINDILTAIESIPGFDDDLPDNRAVEARLQHITSASSTHPLFLIIHNIDAVGLRPTKTRTQLARLAKTSHIHIAASIDHVYAPLLWSSSDMYARKDTAPEGAEMVDGFSWLWHDLTTLRPYDAELNFADRSSYAGATTSRAQGVGNRAGGAGSAVNENAAQHILASVTEKAKKLFILLANKQLELLEAADTSAGSNTISYEALFSWARQNFIATNDTGMRALLGEFKDHGLIVTVDNSASDTEGLQIPMVKESLNRLVQSIT